MILNDAPNLNSALLMAVMLSDQVGPSNLEGSVIAPFCLSYGSAYTDACQFVADVALALSRIPIDSFPLYDIVDVAVQVIKGDVNYDDTVSTPQDIALSVVDHLTKKGITL